MSGLGERQRAFLTRLLGNPDLRSYEREFVGSLLAREGVLFLTAKQREWLSSIWTRVRQKEDA